MKVKHTMTEWEEVPCTLPRARAFMHINNGLRVIGGLEQHHGNDWRHVSVSRADRMPDYDDMQLVKKWFIGGSRDALEYYPKRSEHVNDHPFCRHLWSREDGRRCAPDFRRHDGTGRLSI